MMLLRSLVAALAGASPILVAALGRDQRDLTAFVAAEKAKALQGVLANIGATGAQSQGAKSGVVVAAPSTVSRLDHRAWQRTHRSRSTRTTSTPGPATPH